MRNLFIVCAIVTSFFLSYVSTVKAVDYTTESEEVVIPVPDYGGTTTPVLPPTSPTTPPAPPTPPPVVHAPKETYVPPPPPVSAPSTEPSVDGTIGDSLTENNGTGVPSAPTLPVTENVEESISATTFVGEQTSKIMMALSDFVEVVRKQVFENPQVKIAVNTVVVPATTVVTVTAVTTANFAFVIQYLLFLFSQPFAFLDRRRAKRWGTVYNAFNKMPVDLATVRLIDETGRVIRTRVTDSKGRYLFIASEGNYALEASKTGFAFPAPSIGQKQTDAQYVDLYTGGKIQVKDRAIGNDIPIEPTLDDKEPIKNIMRRHAGIATKHSLAVISTVIALLCLTISFTVWTIAACLAQLLLLLVIERMVLKKRPVKVGKIIGKDNKPVRAVARLFETTYNKLVDSAVTDNSGRFAFLVGANKYYVVAEASGLAPVKSKVFDFSSSSGEQVIAPTLKLG